MNYADKLLENQSLIIDANKKDLDIAKKDS